jgi:hypothetical protein
VWLLFLPLFFGGTGVWTQVFALAKQALYCLNHTSSLLCCGYFGDKTSLITCLSWPQTMILLISASLGARIIGVSHQCPVFLWFLWTHGKHNLQGAEPGLNFNLLLFSFLSFLKTALGSELRALSHTSSLSCFPGYFLDKVSLFSWDGLEGFIILVNLFYARK